MLMHEKVKFKSRCLPVEVERLMDGPITKV